MIQPGDRNEDNILKWLKHFPELLKEYSSAHPSVRGAIEKDLQKKLTTADDDGNTRLSDGTNNDNVVISQSKRPEGTDDDIVVKDNIDPILTSTLYVSLPPLSEAKAAPLPETVRKTMVNELLCFTQNRMNVLPLDNVVKLCSDFYSSDVILEAKQVLFDNVKENKYRFRLYKGENKGAENMRDIAVILYTTEIMNTPRFTAEDLSNLPPLSVDDFDVVRILKEVDSVKQSIKLLGESQSTLAKLVQDRLVSPPQKECSVQPQAHPMAENITPQTQQSSDSYIVLDYTSCSESSEICDDVNNDTISVIDVSLRNDEVFAQQMQQIRHEDPAQCERDFQQRSTKRDYQYDYKASSPMPNRHLTREHVSPRWRTQGSRRDDYRRHRTSSPLPNRHQKQNKVIIGNGPNTDIAAAHNNRDRNNSKNDYNNRSVTGVFVTRLSPRTTSRQMEICIRKQTGLGVRAEKLVTRFDSYNSFYIPCENNIRSTLLDACIWPRGVMVMPFYS
jgi:hypothetical protein